LNQETIEVRSEILDPTRQSTEPLLPTVAAVSITSVDYRSAATRVAAPA
jgi:hypothetical protein